MVKQLHWEYQEIQIQGFDVKNKLEKLKYFFEGMNYLKLPSFHIIQLKGFT